MDLFYRARISVCLQLSILGAGAVLSRKDVPTCRPDFFSSGLQASPPSL